MDKPSKIAVIGMGSWGSAMAICLAKKGHEVHLVGRNPDRVAKVQKDRCNEAYLPGILLPEGVVVTHHMHSALEGASDVIVMVPSVAFGACLTQIKPYVHKDMCVVWGCKGFSQDGEHRFLDDQARSMLGEDIPLVALSGPSFAIELARGMPTAVVLASMQTDALMACQKRLHGPTLRCYVNDDIKGVQLGGVMKNIMAVAAGISDGLGLGANARSALITRGLQEVIYFNQALGLSVESVLGLAGMGDIVLSATSDLSRNRLLGLGIGQGRSVEDMASSLKTLEALNNIRVVKKWVDDLGIDAAIISAVYSVLIEGSSPKEAVQSLMQRSPCLHLKEGLTL